MSYLVALLVTMVIEAIIALLFGFTKISEIIIILFSSLIANQIINLYLYKNKTSSLSKLKPQTILMLEIVVFLVTFLFLKLALPQSSEVLLALSLALTLVSYLGGIYIFGKFKLP